MALIVNLDRGEFLDARELSSVYEVGASTQYMQWLAHLLSSADVSARECSTWPMAGRWMGQSIAFCKEDDFCLKIRQKLLALKPELDHPSMGPSSLSMFQLVDLTCTKLNGNFH